MPPALVDWAKREGAQVNATTDAYAAVEGPISW